VNGCATMRLFEVKRGLGTPPDSIPQLSNVACLGVHLNRDYGVASAETAVRFGNDGHVHCNQTAPPRAFQVTCNGHVVGLYERFTSFCGMRYFRAALGGAARDASKGTKFAAPAVASVGRPAKLTQHSL